MRAASLALPVCAALLLPPTPAAAQRSRDCATIAALADPDSDLARVDLALRRDGTIDVAMSGRSDILVRAEQCELSGPADEFQLACEWRAETQGGAFSRFNFFKVTLDTCLDVEFDLGENSYSKDGYSVLRSFSGSAEEDDEDYRSVDISLELIEYVPQGSAAQYSVQLEFRR